MVPKLLSPPISVENARALAAVAEVTSTTLHMHFNVILPALIGSTSSYVEAECVEGSLPVYGPIGEALKNLSLAIAGPGVYPLLVVRAALPRGA